MKKIILLFLIIMSYSALVFSQKNMREFDIEELDRPSERYESCTAANGALVFYSDIPNLRISIENYPKRVIRTINEENQTYILCVRPNDDTCRFYSITIKADGYVPINNKPISSIKATESKQFKINTKRDIEDAWEDLKNTKDRERRIEILDSLQNTMQSTAPQTLNNNKLINVSGTVYEKDGSAKEALIGTSILVKGTNSYGTVSNIEGKFNLSNISENSTLVFSYIGFKTLEVPLNGRTNIEVIMEEDYSHLRRKWIDIGVTLPSLLFYDTNGMPSIFYNSKEEGDYGFLYPTSKMGSFGLALKFLIFSKYNYKKTIPGKSISLKTDIVYSSYKYNDACNCEETNKNILQRRLHYNAMEIPVTINYIFGGSKMRGGVRLGVQNNFNFGVKYDNYLIDYHLKPAKDNSIIKPYTIDAIIGLEIEADKYRQISYFISYTRSLTNRYNQDYIQNLNNTQIYPLKNEKFERNMISVGFTWYLNRFIQLLK